jgi:hypothetical protein
VCQLFAAASRQKLAHQRAGISLLTPASFQLEGTRPVPPESCGRSPELPAESLGLRVPRSDKSPSHPRQGRVRGTAGPEALATNGVAASAVFLVDGVSSQPVPGSGVCPGDL